MKRYIVAFLAGALIGLTGCSTTYKGIVTDSKCYRIEGKDKKQCDEIGPIWR